MESEIIVPAKRRRKWPRRLAIVLGVIGAAFYYCFIARPEQRVESHGWVLRHSRIRIGCPVCTGRVEELTYQGRTIPVPPIEKVPEDQSNRDAAMLCPVGGFEAWGGQSEWFLKHGALSVVDLPEAITAEELSRGYYWLAEVFGGTPAGIARKLGTPEHWCLLRRSPGDDMGFWMSPELIEQAPGLYKEINSDGRNRNTTQEACGDVGYMGIPM